MASAAALYNRNSNNDEITPNSCAYEMAPKLWRTFVFIRMFLEFDTEAE